MLAWNLSLWMSFHWDVLNQSPQLWNQQPFLDKIFIERRALVFVPWFQHSSSVMLNEPLHDLSGMNNSGGTYAGKTTSSEGRASPWSWSYVDALVTAPGSFSLGRSQFCLLHQQVRHWVHLWSSTWTNCPLSPDLGLSADAFHLFSDLLSFQRTPPSLLNPHLLLPRAPLCCRPSSRTTPVQMQSSRW